MYCIYVSMFPDSIVNTAFDSTIMCIYSGFSFGVNFLYILLTFRIMKYFV